MQRCPWCGTDPLYVRYHDEEWGVPARDDARQFEFLVLESAQAGLSWFTILRKRENYRRVYDGFDPTAVARYGEEKIAQMLLDPGIVRNRMKIEASVNNAKRFLETAAEFGTFSGYIWSFTGGQPVRNAWERLDEVPARTPLSDALALDMKKRGFRFLGSTILYAHLQATGIVNDHLTGCYRYGELEGRPD